MKKIYFLFIVFLSFSFLLNAQTYLAEDFSSGLMPPVGWSIEGQESQWSNAGSTEAGGKAPEAKLTWKQTTDITRLISPEVDLTGSTDLKISFRHFLDNYGGGAYKIGCATRSGVGDWNIVWEVSPNTNIGPEYKFLDVPAADAGASDFEFCFYLDGNMYNFDYWYIDDIKLIKPYALDLELSAIDLPFYVIADDPFNVAGITTNLGLDPITSFDVAYTVDGANPMVSSFTDINLAIGDSYSFTCDQPLSLPTDGSYNIIVTVSNINGGDDDNIDNNELTTAVGVVPYIPEKKVLGEEATGTWCQWCPRGTCYMNYMAETYPDTWIGVAIHNSDPMVVAEYDSAIPSIIPNFPGYPSGTVDRAKGWDPEEFEEAYLERIEAISPATCEITNFSWNSSTRIVTFNVESEFVVDVSHELRFMAIITADSLYGTSSDWAQSNAYSGGGQGPMCGFEDLPSTVPASQMSYDHVAVAVLDTPFGTEGSLPTTILAGETHSYTYTYTIPEEWKYEKLHFIGVLIDMLSGEILNANNVISHYVGVIENTAGSKVRVYPNPSTGKINITDAIGANVSVFDITGNRVAYFNHLVSENIDVSDLNSGMYILNIELVDHSTTVKKFTILK